MTFAPVVFAALMLGAISANPAAAQDAYPNRPIRLVVGFSAGGPTDIPARFIADKLGTLLGQRVFVENKTGAAGMIATRDVLALPADGYNLLFCTHFESINTALYRNAGFKLSDLAPLSLVSKYYYGITITNTIGAETWEQFLQYAKANPNQLSYGSVGQGSAQEIMARQIEKLTGISMNRIPFRSGSQILQDLLAGRVHLYVAPTIGVLPQHQAKQVRIVATTSPQRLSGMSDVPTLRENGIDYVRYGWLGICAKAGTPQPIIDLLNRHIVSIIATRDYRDLIEKGGSMPESSTPQQLGQVLAQTVDEVAATIREYGLQQE